MSDYQGKPYGNYQNTGNNSNQSSPYFNNKQQYSSGNQNRYPSKKNEPFDESKVKLYRSYVGTGNRDTPENILNRMKYLATTLSQFGYVLRCGGMDGPETAFEVGSEETEYHLPWKDFNQKKALSYFNGDEVKTLAKMFQPTFDGLKPVIQAFLCKNVRCIMGKDLKSPVRFIVIWSADGAEKADDCLPATGSMAHVIKIATAMRIPVFNYGKQDAEQRLKDYLEIPYDRNNITEF